MSARGPSETLPTGSDGRQRPASSLPFMGPEYADLVFRPFHLTTIQIIGLRLYDGLFKIIQWQDDKDLKSFNVRFEDHNVTNITFLDHTRKSRFLLFLP